MESVGWNSDRAQFSGSLWLHTIFLSWEKTQISRVTQKKQETGTFRSSCLGCVLGWFSKEARTNRIYLLPTHLPTYLSYKVYYRELAHVVLEAEKSHNVPHASWRAGKASGMVWRLESRGASDVDSGLNLRPENQEHGEQEMVCCPSSPEARWWLQPSSPLLFCSGPNWIG